MSSPSYIPLAWSRGLTSVVVCAHLLPLGCLLGEGVPTWVRGGVLAAVCASGLAALRARQRMQDAILRPFAESATVASAAGALQGRLLSSSLEAGPMVILHWRGEGHRRVRRYILVRDAFSAEDWRQLKVWVRWTVQKSG